MDVVENVVAGLAVAALIWLARWARQCLVRLARQHRAVSQAATATDPTKEQNAMGSPARLKRPDLKPGAHRDLIELMHDLHREAKYPFLWELAEAMGKKSTTTVSDALTKEKLAPKAIYTALAQQLATRIYDRRHLEAMADHIDRRVSLLWERAARDNRPHSDRSIRSSVRQVWDQIGEGRGLDFSPEVVDAVRMAKVQHIVVEGTFIWVEVVVGRHDDRELLGGDSAETKRWERDLSLLVSKWLKTAVDVGVIAH